MKMKYGMWIMLGVCAVVLSGCQTNVDYGDAYAVETLTVDFGSTDLQMIAEKMVDSLVRTPVLGTERPVVYVHEIKNKTMEHIDTKNITDKIRVALLRSGKARFTASSDIPDDLIAQIESQSASRGIVDPATAKRFGKQVGADMMIFGEFTSINKKEGRTKDIYYKFTMNLVDIESGLIEWADEKEIRKSSKRPLIGR
jgi:uncharacterized protein (TIGR02722 family)